MSSPPYQAYLLVDGYNIIGSWNELKQKKEYHGLGAARDLLIESIVSYAPMMEYRTQIVFDAHYRKTRSHVEEYTPLVSVYYTAFAETADTYIEKFCANFKRNGDRQEYPRLIVATNDRAQTLTARGYGAECISAQILAGNVQKTVREIRKKKRPKNKSSGRFLFDGLDPKSQQLLRQWRMGQN